MGKTSAAVKNRYAAKAYDSLRIIVPKGRKEEIEAHVKAQGDSVNGFVNGLIREAMGMSEADWKRTEAEESGEAT